MDDRVEVFDKDPTFACGGWRDLYFGMWRTAVSAEGARRVGAAMERFARRFNPNPITLLFVMEPNCAMPDGAAREVLTKDVKRHDSFTRHMVLAFEGQGFKAAAFRSVLAGMQMVARQKAPMKVVATLQQAAAWLELQPPGQVSARHVVAAFERFRVSANE
jgi:hypothetical protein